MSTRIWTVGHGTRTIEQFVELLRKAGIRRLVDVRTAPGSRRHPQFGRAALAARLADQGIEYAWERRLGGWRRPAPESPHTALRSSAFRGYADHMTSDEFRAALGELITAAARTPTAIMCAETLWWRCHRRLVADALTVAGVDVAHLGVAGHLEPHRLHPALRVVADRLVYDRVGRGTPEGVDPGRPDATLPGFG